MNHSGLSTHSMRKISFLLFIQQFAALWKPLSLSRALSLSFTFVPPPLSLPSFLHFPLLSSSVPTHFTPLNSCLTLPIIFLRGFYHSFWLKKCKCFVTVSGFCSNNAFTLRMFRSLICFHIIFFWIFFVYFLFIICVIRTCNLNRWYHW